MSKPAAVDRPRAGRMPSPPVVALAAWAVPGAGYWLIGERARALTVGVTIMTLFVAGLLIGGVRVLQVPGYGEEGGRVYTWYELGRRSGSSTPQPTGASITSEHPPRAVFNDYGKGPWVATEGRALLGEVGNKPWSICQVMTGPIAVAAGAWSVQASRAVPGAEPAGVLSHSRINEIAVLYTAVAGMLNLLVIIDAAARAGREGEDDAARPAAREAA
jgi:hypothetical protein